MKIVKFTAENVKRLKAVEITPDGNLQVVAGRNAQGKSSVLDAIYLGMGGGAAARETIRPIRDGEETARVQLDLGELIVTREWKGDKTTLTVKSADGAKFSSPQQMLDGLVGSLSFDPLEFTRLSARDQRDALLALVDLPFKPAELDAKRQALYDDRTEIGRQSKALGDVPTVDKSLPEAETSASDLLGKIRAAQEVERAKGDLARQFQDALSKRDSLKDELERVRALLSDADRAMGAVQKSAQDAPSAPDTAALEDDLSTIEDTNAAIRANNQAREQVKAKASLTAKYTDITKQIDALDATKADGLAKAKFPVDGLGFDDGGVTYQGVPFSQASGAEQIRVSLGMAMTGNPKLRVIRIMDGSLLDTDGLKIIADMAKGADWQVWIERVGDGDGMGVIIEDGEVSA